MEAECPNSSVITVHHEITVHTDKQTSGKTNSSLKSFASTIRSPSDMRPRTAEPPLRLDRFRRDSGGSDEGQGALLEKRNDDSMRYLIDFLKNTPPPDNNRRPAPDSCSSSISEESKWSRKFNVFRNKWRRESRKSSPPVVKLPDSAVAARTTGGHRHISISVPYQLGHRGPTSSSQYPVFQPTGYDLARDMDTRLGDERNMEPMQPYASDRGVGTILNSVAEDHESAMSGPPSLRSLASGERRDSGKAACTTAGDAVSSPLGGATGHRVLPEVQEVKEPEIKQSTLLMQPKPQGAAGTSPKTIVVHPKMPPVSPRTEENNKVAESPSNPATEPSEGRSVRKVHSRTTSTVSNSSVLSLNTTGATWTVPDRRSSRKARESQEIAEFPLRNSSSNARRRPRGSFAESVATTDSEPRVFDAQAAKAYNTIPIVVQQNSQRPLDSPLHLNFPLPPLNIMGVTAEPDVPAHTALQTNTSRTELQQGTTATEVDAHGEDYLPAIAGLFEPNSDDVVTDSDTLVPGNLSEAGSAPSSESPPPPLPPKNKKVNFATNLVEVESGPSKRNTPLTTTLIAMKRDSTPNLTSTISAVPTSPAVSSSSHITLDRTSSREWRKTWQGGELVTSKERKTCLTVEAIVEQKESSDQPQQQQQQQQQPSHEEMVVRYGNIMEARFQNMEKGVQRLERNAEIWLRSMVPVMENLDRSLQEQYRYQRNENAWYIMNSATSSSSSSSKALRTRSAERPESLALFRSRDAARKARPHTAGGEMPHQNKLSSSASSSSGGGVSGGWLSRETTAESMAPRPTVFHTVFPRTTFELDKPKRRRAADELDAHMGTRVRGSRARRSGTKRHTTSFGSIPAKDLIGIEPLMRGLQGTARFSMEELNVWTPTTSPAVTTEEIAAALGL